MSPRRRRVRALLPVLLWLWAICVFAAIDLFRNVPELDRVRPDAKLYRAMRYAAHKMVGEPYTDGDFHEELPPAAAGGPAGLLRSLAGPPSAWASAAAEAEAAGGRYTEEERERVRTVVHAALAAATHPTADFPGCIPALRVAAAVGDARTWEIFLGLLRARERVIAKLPLTERRDDLDFLDLVAGAVRERGTDDQRARLRLVLAAALETEGDPETRALLATLAK